MEWTNEEEQRKREKQLDPSGMGPRIQVLQLSICRRSPRARSKTRPTVHQTGHYSVAIAERPQGPMGGPRDAQLSARVTHM
jgi:hypothetical protein